LDQPLVASIDTGSHLVTAGKIQRIHVSSTGGTKMLLPGFNIHKDNHISPNTFAKEVKMSANMISEK
jgi:hypothetical protein